MAQNSQRAKLALKAVPNELTKQANDYYLTITLQNSLTLDDLAREVASTHGHQNAAEVAMLTREVLELANWYLSNGYSVTTPQGSFRTTVRGILTDSELVSAPSRDRISLNVAYTMGSDMRERLDEAELAIEITKTATGPQLFSVVSAQDAQHPDAVTRGESVPVEPAQPCIIRGRNIKVGGEGGEIGVTLKRTDGDSGTTYFFPPSKLYPNTPSQVGFVMPADAPEGSVWQVTICTQLGNNSSKLLKEARTATMNTAFVVGEVSTSDPGDDDEDIDGGGDGGDGDQSETPLG